MFADPFSNLMLVILLFFAGLLIMFIFMMRSIEANWRNQEETRKQMSLSLSDLERKIGDLQYALHNLTLAGAAAEKETYEDAEFSEPGGASGELPNTQVIETVEEYIYTGNQATRGANAPEGSAVEPQLEFDPVYNQSPGAAGAPGAPGAPSAIGAAGSGFTQPAA